MSDWDWNKLIPSWDFNTLSVNGYPSWELQEHNPFYVHFVCPCDGLDSIDIATEWDNDLEFYGNFAYRDWTKSGIPRVELGERYWSGFWFQKKRDAIEFQHRYGGIGSWQDEYDRFIAKCIRERNE